MRNRLIAIFVCILLANVLNYALGEWLDGRFTVWSPDATALIDGSTLTASRHIDQSPDTILAQSAEREALLDFYTWLDAGGSTNYQNWRNALTDAPKYWDDPAYGNSLAPEQEKILLFRALQLADKANASRFLSLLLLIITALMIWGKAFKETYWLTPVLYFGVTLGTVALYGSLDAPLYTAVVAGSYFVYFAAIRLFLPVFHTEWCRMMRPFLTMQLFLLAVMAFRGPELVDYWFWTSDLFRLGFTLVTLLSMFFHLAIVLGVLKKGKMGTAAQYFGYGMPLGFTLGVLGLFMGFYGPVAGASLQQINFELVTLPPEIVAGINPEAPFLLTGAGILLAIVSGIGYFVQRIAR